MNREEYVLAVLSLLGSGTSLSPAQTQKLFFILDREIPTKINGPRFNFVPYDYGPFDADVYSEIENLANEGLAKIDNGFSYRTYGLLDEGVEEGQRLANRLSLETRQYIADVGSFVRKCTFQELVSAIYKQYPEMKEKSVFRE